MNRNSDGREVTLHMYGARASFGEFAVLNRLPRSACAGAIDEVTTLVIYRDDFLKLMEQHFSLVRRVIDVLLERIRYATIFSQNLAFLSASERIAAALVHLVEQNVSADLPHYVRVTQSKWGQHANITHEWVSSTLRLFATEGLIHKQRARLLCLISIGYGMRA